MKKKKGKIRSGKGEGMKIIQSDSVLILFGVREGRGMVGYQYSAIISNDKKVIFLKF